MVVVKAPSSLAPGAKWWLRLLYGPRATRPPLWWPDVHARWPLRTRGVWFGLGVFVGAGGLSGAAYVQWISDAEANPNPAEAGDDDARRAPPPPPPAPPDPPPREIQFSDFNTHISHFACSRSVHT